MLKTPISVAASSFEKLVKVDYAKMEVRGHDVSEIARQLDPRLYQDADQCAALAEVLAKRPDMKEVALDPKRSVDEKRMTLIPLMMQHISRLGSLKNDLRVKIDTNEEERERLEVTASALKWAQQQDPKMELNDCSRLHKLVKAQTDLRLLSLEAAEKLADSEAPAKGSAKVTPRKAVFGLEGAETFLLKHDWVAMVQLQEGDTEAEIMLPAPLCAFEMRMSGRSVIVLATEHEGSVAWTATAEAGKFWVCYLCEQNLPTFELAIQQAKAACIAIDAQVAEHEVHRAPDALNKKRAKQGKPPLRSFSVVDLTKRRRAAPPAEGYAETQNRKRLHFCRGHWRHLEGGRRVWIKWCLKGNPDLGFVSKQYAL